MFWLLGQTDSALEGLGPFVAFGSLALTVIFGLARALAREREENKELTARTFDIVSRVEPLLSEVATAMRESTATVGQAGRDVSRSLDRLHQRLKDTDR